MITKKRNNKKIYFHSEFKGRAIKVSAKLYLGEVEIITRLSQHFNSHMDGQSNLYRKLRAFKLFEYKYTSPDETYLYIVLKDLHMRDYAARVTDQKVRVGA